MTSEQTQNDFSNLFEKYSHVVLVTGARSWDSETSMRWAFRETWRAWGPATVIRPLLISGACPQGADAMAERLWRAEGFDVQALPADWHAHGKAAGPRRNQRMVDLAAALRDHGSEVRCTAFLDLCRKDGCPQGHLEQLMPGTPGHISHGTVDCRSRAVAARLPTFDVFHPSVAPLLPPF